MRRWLLAGVLSVSLLPVAACGDPVDPCQVNPTSTNAWGEWREANGEPLDDDPCDSDDLDGKRHKPATVKPVTVKTPAKQPDKPKQQTGTTFSRK